MKRFTVALICGIGLGLMACSSTSTEKAFKESETIDKDIVVLLHGLGRTNSSMWKLADWLEDAGYDVKRVGYHSIGRRPDEILKDVSKQIDACCRYSPRRVHFVGHSLGGLLVRAYLQDNKLDNLGRVVLMGTPNQGTEFVNHFRDSWWMKFLGPTALSLGTDSDSFPNTLKEPYYPVGVIAGVAEHDMPDDILPGRDDWLVAVESTKLKGMTDFIVIESSHAEMRYNEEVAKQTIAFLKTGHFLHPDK